jgi:hypothetical protein
MKAHLPALGLILLAFSAATAEDVTVAQVLARPREFVGKRVSVTGFFVAANEESSLYITRESAFQSRRKSIRSLYWHVSLPIQGCCERHARIRTMGFIPISARRHVI